MKSFASQTKLHTGKQVVARGGLFENKMRQRLDNLIKERQKLDLAWMRLKKKQSELDLEKEQISARMCQIYSVETIQALHHARMELMRNSDEINAVQTENQSVLKLIHRDILHHLSKISLELEENEILSNKNTTSSQIDPETQEKAFIAHNLGLLSEKIQDELVPREEEVSNLELNAIRHERTRKSAEEEQIRLNTKIEALKAEIKDSSRKMKDIEQQMKLEESQLSNATLAFEEEQRTEHDLQHLSSNLESMEHQLQERQEKINKKRDLINTMQQKRKKLETEIKTRQEERQKALEALPKDVPEQLREIENHLSSKDVELSDAIKTLEQNSQDVATRLESEISGLKNRIKVINSSIADKEELPRLMASIAKKQTEIEFVSKQLADKRAELESLKAKLLSEDDLKRIDEELMDEMKKVSLSERDVLRKISEYQRQEDDLTETEDDMETNKESLENELKVAKLNLEGSEKMLNLYNVQLDGAQKHLRTLEKQIEELSR